jgi:hypothetical protein
MYTLIPSSWNSLVTRTLIFVPGSIGVVIVYLLGVHVVKGVRMETVIGSMFASIPETKIGMPLLTVEPERLRK